MAEIDAKKAKMRAMMAAVKALEKSTKHEGIAYRLGDSPISSVERFSSGNLAFDVALGGGIAKGRIIEFFGAESSGKSLLSNKAIAECQKAGGICAVVDAEHAFDPSFAAKFGVDINELFISQPDHMTEAFDVILKFIDAGCDLIVLDSVAALSPKEEFESNEPIKVTMGLVARGMSQFLKKIVPRLSTNNSTLICINQIRDNIGVMYGDTKTTTGGNALKFYSSIRVQVTRDKTLDAEDKKTGDIYQRGIKCTIKKNKTAIPYRKCSFAVYLDGRETSKDITDDIAGIALNMGYVIRCNKDGEPTETGKYYKCDNGEESFIVMGKANLAGKLKEYPNLKDYLLQIIKGEIEAPDPNVEKEAEEDELFKPNEDWDLDDDNVVEFTDSNLDEE